MAESNADYTNTFRSLSGLNNIDHMKQLQNHFIDTNKFSHWQKEFTQRIRKSSIDLNETQKKMKCNNPKYILRN